MNEKSQVIMVVGGYGEVGRHVVRTLVKLQRTVLVAGRSASKAQAFLDTLERPHQVSFRALDLNHYVGVQEASLRDVTTVVMCTDQPGTHFVKLCLEKGIRYIDISADDSFLRKVEALNATAQKANTQGVLSVGLAPGLTNLLAREGLDSNGQAARIEIGVMLGTGDSHGEQALNWTLQYLLKWNQVAKPLGINYSAPWNVRTSYPFEFSDQYSLRRTLHIETFTYLTFSSRLLTLAMFSLRLPGLRQLAQMFPRALKFVGGIPWGGEKSYAIQIKTFGKNGEVIRASVIKGEVEALVTGVTAAAVADALENKTLPTGVFHIHQLLKISDIWNLIQKHAGAELALLEGK